MVHSSSHGFQYPCSLLSFSGNLTVGTVYSPSRLPCPAGTMTGTIDVDAAFYFCVAGYALLSSDWAGPFNISFVFTNYTDYVANCRAICSQSNSSAATWVNQSEGCYCGYNNGFSNYASGSTFLVSSVSCPCRKGHSRPLSIRFNAPHALRVSGQASTAAQIALNAA